ncbi:MAG: hypothetical protein ACLS48_13960 [[Eubacterium] siraeum]
MPKSIYKDISERTGGNIYIGVVGPVRSGKSTFISRFMNVLVVPSIEDEFRRKGQWMSFLSLRQEKRNDHRAEIRA